MLGAAGHHTHRRRQLSLAALVACLGVLAASPPVLADMPPEARELSQFETSWGASVDRDCGFSQAIGGGRALWLFCDTQVYNAVGEAGEFVGGSTSAAGPYESGEVPTALIELPTPPASPSSYPSNAGPQQFLPPPTDVHAPGGGSCSAGGDYGASWPSGLTAVPGTQMLLVVYDEVCVHDWTPYVEGLAMREYNPASNTLSAPSELFAPSSSGAVLPVTEQLGSPIFSEGYFYMFAASCSEHDEYGDCVYGEVNLMGTLGARGYYNNPGKYEWETSTGWSTAPSASASIIPGATPEDSAGLTVNSYPGEGLALITETNLGGGYQVWLSPSGNPDAGRWSEGPSAPALPGCSGGSGLNLCRALTGHPEISDSSDLLMSYFDPALNHIDVVAVPW